MNTAGPSAASRRILSALFSPASSALSDRSCSTSLSRSSTRLRLRARLLAADSRLRRRRSSTAETHGGIAASAKASMSPALVASALAADSLPLLL